MTARVAQGITVDRAFILGSETVYREWDYVAFSHARHRTRFYVVEPEISEEHHTAAGSPRTASRRWSAAWGAASSSRPESKLSARLRRSTTGSSTSKARSARARTRSAPADAGTKRHAESNGSARIMESRTAPNRSGHGQVTVPRRELGTAHIGSSSSRSSDLGSGGLIRCHRAVTSSSGIGLRADPDASCRSDPPAPRSGRQAARQECRAR